MATLYSDLHIHSCLSPCGSDDMTPANICGMAALKGLQMIAVTDHNTASNLPYVRKCADAYGLLLIPGMEVTTREEVHVLAYFASVSAAMDFSGLLRKHMPKAKNKPQFFGNQFIMDEDDNVVGTEDLLLMGASDLSFTQLVHEVRECGGVPVPAHINRGSNGILMNMGFIPPEANISAVEVWRALPCPPEEQNARAVLHSSDAHYLGDILEAEVTVRIREKTPESFLDMLRGT